jgi:glycosyltransferase involved in cell wall biosynthesis
VRIRVLHVTPALSRGGAGRALIAAARASAEVADLEHFVASVQAGDPWMVEKAEGSGFAVLDAPGAGELRSAIEAADVVQVHFWNSPALYELLFTDLPPMRLLIWSHVAGEHPPQVLVPELIEFADRTLASSEYTTEVPGLQGLEVIPAVPGWERIEGVRRRNGAPFSIGYIGTIDFAKLHPEFVSISARMQVPGARFVVCGTGGALPTLRRQAAEQGVSERFDFRGYVEDIRSALATMDVFGYPLSDGNSATSELALQEVMYAGVPPVVLGSGGAPQVVRHGETGLVAGDEREYRQSVEELYANPEQRERLGAAAREHARRTWSPECVAGRWADVYEDMMRRPKRRRSWAAAPAGDGAGRFLQSLGGRAPHFEVSMGADDRKALDADRRVAASPPVLCTGGGGILAYRDYYPEDGWLRLWTGLVLHRQGRRAIAAGEFAAAIQRGCGQPRVRRYLSRATLGARLRSGPCAIAYMGTSVTVQKDGYRPLLHAKLQSRLGRDHVMVNAGTGAIGSVGGLFLMDHLVLRHRPRICFIEYATADAERYTPAPLVGPVVEEIVLRLREAECEPCFLLFPRADQSAAGLDAYVEVAGHHGVAWIDVGGALEEAGLGSDDVLRDVVHTTPRGAEAYAEEIAVRFDSILDPTGAAPASAGRHFDRSFEGARLLPASPERLRDPGACTIGRFRLLYPYVEIEPGARIECSFEEELVGLLVVVGPESGVIRAGSREHNLFDRWCSYERLSTVVFDPGFEPGSRVTIEPTDKPVDRSVLRGVVDEPETTKLKVVGFMVRPC